MTKKELLKRLKKNRRRLAKLEFAMAMDAAYPQRTKALWFFMVCMVLMAIHGICFEHPFVFFNCGTVACTLYLRLRTTSNFGSLSSRLLHNIIEFSVLFNLLVYYFFLMSHLDLEFWQAMTICGTTGYLYGFKKVQL